MYNCPLCGEVGPSIVTLRCSVCDSPDVETGSESFSCPNCGDVETGEVGAECQDCGSSNVKIV